MTEIAIFSAKMHTQFALTETSTKTVETDITFYTIFNTFKI